MLTCGDGSKKQQEMIPTDDEWYIHDKNSDFVEAISNTKVDTLEPHWSIDQSIDLEPGCDIPY